MADIKTRDIAEKSIKTLDRSKVMGERMKDAYIRTKDTAEQSVDTAENSTEEYAADKIEGAVRATTQETVHQFDKQGQKGVKTTKENVSKVRERLQKKSSAETQLKELLEAPKSQTDIPKSETIKTPKKNVKSTSSKMVKKSSKTVKNSAKSAKQTVKNTGKTTVKTTKGTVKTAQKSIKTAEKTSKVAIKTAEKTAKATKAAAKASVRAAKAAAQAARAAVKTAIAAAKIAVKAVIAAVKAIIAAVKAIVAAIAAGGWVAVVIIIVICLVALIVGSCFGIFFSNEDTGSSYSMQSVITEINNEYNEQIESIKSRYTYDVLEMSGATAAWEEVLSVYSVKTTTDPNNATEAATIDDSKKALIREIFWLMNTLTAQTETRTETVVTQSVDDHGNIVETTTTVTNVYLYITVTHKSTDEIANHYGFNETQRIQLSELLSESNQNVWSSLIPSH